jgi:hypothetical protein
MFRQLGNNWKVGTRLFKNCGTLGEVRVAEFLHGDHLAVL